jgi:methyl-accepting chemotaxis protein
MPDKKSGGGLISRMDEFFLLKYDRSTDRDQARAIVLSSMAICLITILGGAVIVDPQYRLILWGLSAFSFALTFLVKRGRAALCGAILAFSLSFAFGIIPLTAEFLNGYELYLIATLECLIMAITGIISNKGWQPLGVMGIGTASLVFDFFVRVNPRTHGINRDDFILCVAILAISAFVSRAILLRNQKRLAESEAEARRSKEQLARLKLAVSSSRASLDQGIRVRESADRTRELVAKMRDFTQLAQTRMDELTASAQTLQSAQEAIASSSESVKASISEQSVIVNESSAAVTEMTSSIGNISAIMESRRTSIQELKVRTEAGAGQMGAAERAVRSMEKSAETIVEVIKVIKSVAARTNLLAMNAAIEAAHAGEYGRGFAVVADEIRKLSETTAENVKLINQNVKETIASMESVANTSGSAQSIFSEIDARVSEVSDSLEDVARGIQEVAAGTEQILQGTSSSVNITGKVQEAEASVDERIKEVRRDVAGLESIAADVENQLDAMARGLDALIAETGLIHEIGASNEDGLRRLSDELAGLA